MPFINVRIVRELIADAPEAKKAAISEGITKAIVDATGHRAESVWIVIEEVEARDWYVAGETVEARWARAAAEAAAKK